MGMTLWLYTDPAPEGVDELGNWDLSSLGTAETQLDAVCDSLGVTGVSSFVRFADPDTGLSPSDESPWPTVADGCATFEVLLEALLGNGELIESYIQFTFPRFSSDRMAQLIRELEYLLVVLEAVGAGRFCLGPVA
jgi:hypothetical protein